MNNLNKQSGFTLVEIAIVLVIIGLLLGGVLKGQEMIKNAEIRSVITDVRGLTTAMYAYRDRYNAIPGDDALGSTHTGIASSKGDGDGVIEAAKEIKINVPLVVRLAGTNFLEGKKILDNSGLKLISAENLDDAAKKIVEAIK